MPTRDVIRLAVLLRQQGEAILTRWREQVRQLPSARDLDIPTLNDHVPHLIMELSEAIDRRSGKRSGDQFARDSSPEHGSQRFHEGFNVTEVVAEYNILRGCIYDLADANGLNLGRDGFHILNHVFDSAIGVAVETYATEREAEIQRRREEYLSFVAHDLRTPLNAISLATRMLESTRTAPKDRTDPLIKTLQRNVRQLETLVAKVLEESGQVQTQLGLKLYRRSFDLWPFVESLIQDLSPATETANTVLINTVSQDLVVYADADMLRRILENLISNAIRYTSPGRVHIGAQETDDAVECWVSDDGTGIPAALLDRVFEKGETDPENKERAGLGLAIVKTFVEAHGGTVKIDSIEGRGTTIRFTLSSNSQMSSGSSATTN